MMVIEYAAKTHCGFVRENNEDNFWINGCYKEKTECKKYEICGREQDSEFAVAVCDGMGGEENGEIAALYAVESMKSCRYLQFKDNAFENIRLANEKICDDISKNNGKRSGAAIAALYIDEQRAFGCNVGDCRIYRYLDGKLELLSRDHTRAQSMVQLGIMTREEADKSKEKHRLTQYLGIFEHEMIIEPDYMEWQIQEGEMYLLCSDGLTDMLWDAEIEMILSEQESPQELCTRLVEEALASGGKDNVTVILLRILK